MHEKFLAYLLKYDSTGVKDLGNPSAPLPLSISSEFAKAALVSYLVNTNLSVGTVEFP